MNINDENCQIIISEQSGALTLFDLLQSEGSLVFDIEFIDQTSGDYLFYLKTTNFHFSFFIGYQKIEIVHNHYSTIVYPDRMKLRIVSTWSPTQIAIYLKDDTGIIIDTSIVETPSIIPSTLLLSIAKKNHCLPLTTYTSEEEYRSS